MTETVSILARAQREAQAVKSHGNLLIYFAPSGCKNFPITDPALFLLFGG
jgi:hypothetical protein